MWSTGSAGGKALIRSICISIGQFEDANLTSLKVELGRDAQQHTITWHPHHTGDISHLQSINKTKTQQSNQEVVSFEYLLLLLFFTGNKNIYFTQNNLEKYRMLYKFVCHPRAGATLISPYHSNFSLSAAHASTFAFSVVYL